MRTNTFSLEFVDLEAKLNAYSAHIFIQDKLKLKAEEVIAIGIYDNKVMIKVESRDVLESIFEKYESGLEYIDVEGKIYKVKLANESLKNVVRIHRIPIEVPDAEIKKTLERYGLVESVSNDLWKNLPYRCYNDTKVVKMEIHNPVPSYIRIAGNQYWVTYVGQVKTCRKCASTAHEAKDCTFTIGSRLRQRSYASMASGIFRKQYLEDRDNLLEENYSPLKSPQSSAFNERKGSNASTGSKQESFPQGADTVGNRAGRDTQPVSETEKKVDGENEGPSGKEIEIESGNDRVVTNESSSEVESNEGMQEGNHSAHDANSGEESKMHATKARKMKKRKKSTITDSGESGIENVGQNTKKLNWAKEVEQEIESTDDVKQRGTGDDERPAQKHPNDLMRTSSIESSY